MQIDIDYLSGQKIQAKFGEHTIISDQSIAAGGNGEYPEPFDYFLASLPLCAAFYIRKFCQQRDIDTQGIRISQTNENIENQGYKKKISLQISLPDDFPEKYKKAVINAANTCTVKKVIQAMPEFEINIA